MTHGHRAGRSSAGGKLSSIVRPRVAAVTTTVEARRVYVDVRLVVDDHRVSGHAEAGPSRDGAVTAAARATLEALTTCLGEQPTRMRVRARHIDAAHVTSIVTLGDGPGTREYAAAAPASEGVTHAAAIATIRALAGSRRLDATHAGATSRVTPPPAEPRPEPTAASTHQLDDRRLLTIASHQLRGPVGVLTGYLRLLDDRWSTLDDAARLEMVRRASQQGRRVDRRLHDLLMVTAEPSAPATGQPSRQSVEDLVRQAVTDVSAMGPADVAVAVPPDLHVVADPGHARQALGALLDNALRHGAPPVSVTATRRDQTVEICVVDHGPGVPAGMRAHLFDPRPEAHDTHSTGLGLHVAQLLARANGGRVEHRPEPGGTRFCLVLPADGNHGPRPRDAGHRTIRID